VVIQTAINYEFIPVGSSLDKSDAELLAKRFERVRYSLKPILSDAEPNRYKLKFGPYPAAEAASARGELVSYWHGLTFHLIVTTPAGKLVDQATADSALEAMQRLGAHARRVRVEENKYQVEIGPFVTQQEAMDAGEELSRKYDDMYCPGISCPRFYAWTGSPPKLLCNSAGPFCEPD
jgi:hypothetical protein